MPELLDVGMRLPPSTDECFDFILRTIRLKLAPSALSAGITKCEIGDFADAAFRVVLCVGPVWFVEYLAGGDAVGFVLGIVSSIRSTVTIQFPIFAGNPGQDPAFD